MKLSELVSKVSAENEITKKKAREVIASVFTGITGAMKEENGDILIPDFGRFTTVVRKARQGSNLNTGEKLHIPSKTKITFNSTKALKAEVEKILE